MKKNLIISKLALCIGAGSFGGLVVIVYDTIVSRKRFEELKKFTEELAIRYGHHR